MTIQQVSSKKTAPPPVRTKRVTEEARSSDRFVPNIEARMVKVSYVPQDPGMLPIQTAEVKSDGTLRNERFQVSVGPGFPTPKPDREGNFLTDDLNDPRLDATNCFFIANQTLEMAERYAGGSIEWGFQESLGHPMLVKPHAGKEVMNAFYNSESGSINFFSYFDEKSGERKRTGMNRDIISHEVGHAILDAIRPNFINGLSVGAGGFHESFADISAMLSALNDDHVIEALRLQTKGDLSKPNMVSSIGEEMGAAVFEEGPLREAVNKHKYADQAFLPYFDEADPGSGLGTECHSYANLFNGAWYEVFVQFYNQASANPDTDFKSALIEARDKAGALLLRSVEMGPVGDTSAREAAMSFLRADMVDNEGANLDTLTSVFLERKILRQEDVDIVKRSQESLPEVQFCERLANDEKAIEWLDEHREQLGLPDDVEFEFDRVRTNDSGERFVAFKTSRDKLLEGPSFGDYEGSQIRSMGGVLLGFDAEGALITHQYDEVSDRELEDITNFFRGSLQAGAITRATGEPPAYGKNKRPKMQIESVVENGHRVLRRGGVI